MSGTAESGTSVPERMVQRLLRGVREHLDLEVAFVGEVADGRRTFRFVDVKEGAEGIVSPGASNPLDDSYCGHVIEGRIPEFLLDPSTDPVAAEMRVTCDLPVGTHLSVPIRFTDGRVYGTFCCFSRQVKEALRDDDMKTMRLMSEMAGEYLEALDAEERRWRERRALIEGVLSDPGALTVVFQPLRDLETMRVTSVEALSRFNAHGKGPDWFFGEASAVGLGIELELFALRTALDALDVLPDTVRLNVNVSPDTLISDEFLLEVKGLPRGRLVVEVTEHAAVEDYAQLRAASARLADQGIDLSVDDVGMGFSGFNRILESDPSELKLDAIVVRGVETNAVKQALVETFCSFGRRAGFEIVAEGIETAAELETLRELRVATGQGYHLGRPAPLEAVLAELTAEGRS